MADRHADIQAYAQPARDSDIERVTGICIDRSGDRYISRDGAIANPNIHIHRQIQIQMQRHIGIRNNSLTGRRTY